MLDARFVASIVTVGVTLAVTVTGGGCGTPASEASRETAPVTGLFTPAPADFPDPAILPWDGQYYAYATGPRVSMMVSSDLDSWGPVKRALRKVPAWADSAVTWAPTVLPIEGAFVMYYSIAVAGEVNDNGAPLMCISRAVAASPEGPFDDESTAPIVCQRDLGGSIDPSAYVDTDMTPWLVWKSDGNCCNIPSRIWSAPLASDGLSTVGAEHGLLASGHAWDRGVVEGPSLTRHGDRLYLFYSGNLWNTEHYAMGYAECASPAGPCTDKSVGGAWAFSHAPTNAWGPGGQEWFKDLATGRLQMAFHAWSSEAAADVRTLHVGAVVFGSDGVPELSWR